MSFFSSFALQSYRCNDGILFFPYDWSTQIHRITADKQRTFLSVFLLHWRFRLFSSIFFFKCQKNVSFRLISIFSMWMLNGIVSKILFCNLRVRSFIFPCLLLSDSLIIFFIQFFCRLLATCRWYVWALNGFSFSIFPSKHNK